MKNKMENKMIEGNELVMFNNEDESWLKFKAEFEQLLFELQGYKIQYWSVCNRAGVRIFIDLSKKWIFNLDNVHAVVSIREVNALNELEVDIWKEYNK